MMTSLYRIAAILLIAGMSAGDAAPAVPPSDMPGRERERFTSSPLDRFMQPSRPAEPLMRWPCDERGWSRSKQRARHNRGC